jgi:hypothetical protein
MERGSRRQLTIVLGAAAAVAATSGGAAWWFLDDGAERAFLDGSGGASPPGPDRGAWFPDDRFEDLHLPADADASEVEHEWWWSCHGVRSRELSRGDSHGIDVEVVDGADGSRSGGAIVLTYCGGDLEAVGEWCASEQSLGMESDGRYLADDSGRVRVAQRGRIV